MTFGGALTSSDFVIMETKIELYHFHPIESEFLCSGTYCDNEVLLYLHCIVHFLTFSPQDNLFRVYLDF